MFQRCDKEEFELFLVIARKIWFRRNTVIYIGEFLHLTTLTREAVAYMSRNIRRQTHHKRI
jgi:hypothetical protein